MPRTASDDIDHIADPGSFAPRTDGLRSSDPLLYPGYSAAIERARDESGSEESVSAGPATIEGHEVELALFNFRFFGGSMGEVAGERLARAMEEAAARSVPFVLRTSTGGARMQEGMRALVQMPKVVTARLMLADAHQPFVALLGHPTTGGVLASLASLADVTVAEEGATVGFAGPRVVEGFTGKRLRQGSHTAESAFAHGLVDAVVAPADARRYVAAVLDTLSVRSVPLPPRAPSAASAGREIDAWEAVQTARASDRPRAPDLVRALSDAFVELHGDRAGLDDPAVVAALARVRGRPMIALALDRDHAPGPAAYRKARRCLAIATRLNLPVVTFVDTAGADPSEDAEAGGIAWEIAQLFEAMLTAPIPTLSIVTGEGGSGGALAFATSDVVVAWADSIFSVIGPESAAQILWRDSGRAEEAARLLKLTAPDLYALGTADALVDPPLEAGTLAAAVCHYLERLASDNTADRSVERRKRWRGGRAG